MKITFFLIAVLSLVACGGSDSNKSHSDSGNDIKLIGSWISKQDVRFNNGGCSTLNGKTGFFYEMVFRKNDYDVLLNACKPIDLGTGLFWLEVIEDASYGVKYKTGGIGTFDIYENGVLTKEFKDFDIINNDGSTSFYTTYWTDGVTLELAGFLSCGSGTTGETVNDRCIPKINSPVFVRK